LEPIKESISININLTSAIKVRIILDIAEGSNEDFSETPEALLNSFASLASAFFFSQRYNILQGQFTKELVTFVTNILEIYDRYTSSHSKNVAEMAADIAESMNLSQQEIKDAYWAGMVHDIGKQ
jgi:HD-GYP domain-containing protein (c-di-GMP phosphodiesterase class II)